jgi:RNA polymerase sigma factor (sigma-70 family)
VELETTEWPPTLVANYSEHRLALIRVAALILGSRALAEEAVHDAVMSVRGKWDGLDHPGAYLRTAVVNRAKEILRHRRLDWPIYEVAGELPESLVDLHRYLGRLPHRQRVAVVLRFFADLDDDETADQLGCRPGTVRSLISRALDTLRKEMNQ